MKRGQLEYLDYLETCKANNKEPEVFICWKCQHPLKSKEEVCPQCGS